MMHRNSSNVRFSPSKEVDQQAETENLTIDDPAEKSDPLVIPDELLTGHTQQYLVENRAPFVRTKRYTIY